MALKSNDNVNANVENTENVGVEAALAQAASAGTSADISDLDDLVNAATASSTTDQFSQPDATEVKTAKEKKPDSAEKKYTKQVQAFTSSLLAQEKTKHESSILTRCMKEISEHSRLVAYVTENDEKVDLTLALNKEKSGDAKIYDYAFKMAGPSTVKAYGISVPIDLSNKLADIRESQNKGDITAESVKKMAQSTDKEIRFVNADGLKSFLKSSAYNYVKEDPRLFVPFVKVTNKNGVPSVSEGKSIMTPDNNPAFSFTGGVAGMYVKVYQQGAVKSSSKSRYDELNPEIGRLDRTEIQAAVRKTIEFRNKLVNTGRARCTGCTTANGEVVKNYISLNRFKTYDPAKDFDALQENQKRKLTKAYFGRFNDDKIASLSQSAKQLFPAPIGGKYPISPAFVGDENAKKYWEGIEVKHYYLKNADGSPVMLKVNGTGVNKLNIVQREARVRGGAEITDFSAEGQLKSCSSVTPKENMAASSAAGGYSWDDVPAHLKALLPEFDGSKFIAACSKVTSNKGASNYSNRNLKAEFDPALYTMLDDSAYYDITVQAILKSNAQ